MPHARVEGPSSAGRPLCCQPPIVARDQRVSSRILHSDWKQLERSWLLQAATAKGDPAAPCAMGPSHNGHGHYYSSKSLGVSRRHPCAPSGMSRLPAVPTDCVRDVCFCATVLANVQKALHCQ